jgi:hypothetical protein
LPLMEEQGPPVRCDEVMTLVEVGCPPILGA